MNNYATGILIAAVLIFGGLLMQSCETKGLSNSIVNLAEATDKRFDGVEQKLDMVMYGQLLQGGQQAPIVVTK